MTLTLQLFKNSNGTQEAQIKLPLIECECAFRIRAFEQKMRYRNAKPDGIEKPKQCVKF
jgi:hypothetical protein